MIEFLKHTSTRETKLHCFSSKIEYIQFHSIPFHTKGGTRETHIISKLPSIKLPRNNRHITEIVTHSHFLVKYVVKFVCPTYIFGVYVFVSQQKTIDARKTKIGAKRRQRIVRKWDEGGLVKDEHRRWYAKRKTKIVKCARRLRAENEQIYSKSVR